MEHLIIIPEAILLIVILLMLWQLWQKFKQLSKKKDEPIEKTTQMNLPNGSASWVFALQSN